MPSTPDRAIKIQRHGTEWLSHFGRVLNCDAARKNYANANQELSGPQVFHAARGLSGR